MNRTKISALIALTTIMTSVLPAKAQWVNPNVLATDHRAYCSDIVASNTYVDRATIDQKNIYSRNTENNRSNQQSSTDYRKKSGSGGFKVFRIGGNGSGESITNRSSQIAYRLNQKEDLFIDNSSVNIYDRTKIISNTVGKNCDAFVQNAALVETTKINADVNRELIQSQKKVKLRQIEANAQTNLFNTLMQGW